MKRFIVFFVVGLLIISTLPVSAFAAEPNPNADDVIYFEDGSYIIIEISVADTRAVQSKSPTKTYIYHNTEGAEQWRAVLQGTFAYDGSISTCTASICTVSIADDSWHVVSKTTSKSGGTAFADLTMGKKFLGIITDKETIHMSLTCDKNGNIS